MTQQQWDRRTVAVTAGEVRRHRDRRGLSAQQLADACERDYGLPLTRGVIANLESGRRPIVSLSELFVLAKVLQVPPLALILPIGHQQTVEVLPGCVVDVWEAAQWVVGEQPLPDEKAPDAWEESAAPIRLYRAHERYVQEWRTSRNKFASLVSAGLPGAHVGETDTETGGPLDVEAALAEMTSTQMSMLERAISEVRAEMRRRELVPPALPHDLAHLDAEPPERS